MAHRFQRIQAAKLRILCPDAVQHRNFPQPLETMHPPAIKPASIRNVDTTKGKCMFVLLMKHVKNSRKMHDNKLFGSVIGILSQ